MCHIWAVSKGLSLKVKWSANLHFSYHDLLSSLYLSWSVISYLEFISLNSLPHYLALNLFMCLCVQFPFDIFGSTRYLMGFGDVLVVLNFMYFWPSAWKSVRVYNQLKLIRTVACCFTYNLWSILCTLTSLGQCTRIPHGPSSLYHNWKGKGVGDLARYNTAILLELVSEKSLALLVILLPPTRWNHLCLLCASCCRYVTLVVT